MRVTFTDDGWADYCSWTGDRKMLTRINRLMDESRRDPAAGIGKPEPLSQNLSGFWSRRITDEHRPVYTVTDGSLIIIQARYHY